MTHADIKHHSTPYSDSLVGCYRAQQGEELLETGKRYMSSYLIMPGTGVIKVDLAISYACEVQSDSGMPSMRYAPNSRGYRQATGTSCTGMSAIFRPMVPYINPAKTNENQTPGKQKTNASNLGYGSVESIISGGAQYERP